jgi:hypothetical protein
MTRPVIGRLNADAHQVADPKPDVTPSEGAHDVQLKAMNFADAAGHLAPDAREGYAAQRGALAPVQAKGNPQGDVHALAEHGTSGSGSALPHANAIQMAFGHHDVSTIQAHTGGAAAEANQAMGAQAYATGNAVAFGGAPSLHTAAHEAAHVVQQRAGVSLSGGVGQTGDRYEQHADAVADQVVSGQSAEGLLNTMTGHAPSVQRKAAGAVQFEGQATGHKKVVSGKAGNRLGPAADAIAYTKRVFSQGAGNQHAALDASNFNSAYRLTVMRDFKYWNIDPTIIEVAQANPNALTAAMAEIAQGGNCGEHAMVAYDYLRTTAKGEKITQAHVDGFDHAFVIMGDIDSEGDADLVVSDPWPTAATVTLWEDHFAYGVNSDREALIADRSCTADGANMKDVIKAGISLNAMGLKIIEMSLSEEETDEKIKEGTSREDGNKPWIWRHEDAAASGKKYNYTPGDS